MHSPVLATVTYDIYEREMHNNVGGPRQYFGEVLSEFYSTNFWSTGLNFDDFDAKSGLSVLLEHHVNIKYPLNVLLYRQIKLTHP